MQSFLLILTLCGTLNNNSTSCEDFVLDTNQTELDCYKSIATVYNHDKNKLYDLMADASNDWFKQVKVTKLACVQEDVE